MAGGAINFSIDIKLLLVNIGMTFFAISGQDRKLLYSLIFGCFFIVAIAARLTCVLAFEFKISILMIKSDFIPFGCDMTFVTSSLRHKFFGDKSFVNIIMTTITRLVQPAKLPLFAFLMT